MPVEIQDVVKIINLIIRKMGHLSIASNQLGIPELETSQSIAVAFANLSPNLQSLSRAGSQGRAAVSVGSRDPLWLELVQ